ncbi:MAG: PASTA domain-containing protein [Fusobacteriaceae bacterium]
MSKLTKFLPIISIIVIIFLIFNVGLDLFFNEKYYYTPDFSKMNIEDAVSAVQNTPIKIQVGSEEFSSEPAGTIFLQEPEAGRVVKKGRVITVLVSKGQNEKVVPDVAGINVEDAHSIIQSKGFSFGNLVKVFANLPEGQVIATDPSSNEVAPMSNQINILVGTQTAPANFYYDE